MPPTKPERLEEVGSSSVMLLNFFSELFLNSTLLKFGVGSFGLPDNFTIVGVLPEFGKRFPALSNSSLALELGDRLALGV